MNYQKLQLLLIQVIHTIDIKSKIKKTFCFLNLLLECKLHFMIKLPIIQYTKYNY